MTKEERKEFFAAIKATYPDKYKKFIEYLNLKKEQKYQALLSIDTKINDSEAKAIANFNKGAILEIKDLLEVL